MVKGWCQRGWKHTHRQIMATRESITYCRNIEQAHPTLPAVHMPVAVRIGFWKEAELGHGWKWSRAPYTGEIQMTQGRHAKRWSLQQKVNLEARGELACGTTASSIPSTTYIKPQTGVLQLAFS